LAKVITDKFADHLPLTRQAKRFQREAGVDIAVSTMCGWLRQSADLLKHVVKIMAQELREGQFVQSDATGFPILEGSKNQPRRGQLWSFSDAGQVVGRKNWMFAGSEGGAKTAAICFSIVGSCVLVGIDPYAYLRDILSLLPDAKPAQLKTLTPRAWAARFGPTAP